MTLLLIGKIAEVVVTQPSKKHINQSILYSLNSVNPCFLEGLFQLEEIALTQLIIF